MNFKKLIFIIYTFSLLSGQAISTPKTIKPVIELDPIDETSAITFIGFEGDTQKGGTVDYKVAKLYSISKNNQLFLSNSFASRIPSAVMGILVEP